MASIYPHDAMCIVIVLFSPPSIGQIETRSDCERLLAQQSNFEKRSIWIFEDLKWG